MNDGDALLQAIRDDPADDLPRLAYADWLEETGAWDRWERAQVIRCMVGATAALSRRLPVGEAVDWDGYRDRGRYQYDIVAELVTNGSPVQSLCFRAHDESQHVVWCRGFIESVRLPLAAWLEHGPALVAAHPITRVELGDREPWQCGGADGPFGWFRCCRGETDESDEITPAVWELLVDSPVDRPATIENRRWKFWPSREAALDALSVALLAWAHAQNRRPLTMKGVA